MLAATTVKSPSITTMLLRSGANVLFQNSKGNDVMNLITNHVRKSSPLKEDLDVLRCILPYYLAAGYNKAARAKAAETFIS